MSWGACPSCGAPLARVPGQPLLACSARCGFDRRSTTAALERQRDGWQQRLAELYRRIGYRCARESEDFAPQPPHPALGPGRQRALVVHQDPRGAVFEAFRASWFGEEPGHESEAHGEGWLGGDPSMGRVSQAYISITHPDTAKGWHAHTAQTDRFLVVRGRLVIATSTSKPRNASPSRWKRSPSRPTWRPPCLSSPPASLMVGTTPPRQMPGCSTSAHTSTMERTSGACPLTGTPRERGTTTGGDVAMGSTTPTKTGYNPWKPATMPRWRNEERASP